MTSLVLAAIDLSHPEDQEGVLRRANDIAQMEGARLAVISVLPDYGVGFIGSFFPDDHSNTMVEEARVALHKFVQNTIGDDESVKHVVRMGTTYEEVLKTAELLNATLIVMGAHKPEFTDYLIGPNAARVARHANCSVYIHRVGPTAPQNGGDDG